MLLNVEGIITRLENAVGWAYLRQHSSREQRLRDIEAEITRLRTAETEAIAFRDRIEVDERLAAEQFLPEVSDETL